MTNREEPNKDYQQIADMVRRAGGQHSGNIPVEQGGERPVHEYDNTPLDEAVGTHIDPEAQPDDLSTIELQPHETAAIDQSSAARRPVLPPTPPRPPEAPSDWSSRYNGQPNHTKRNALVASGLAGTLAIAAISYFALRGGSDHNPTNTSEGHLQPGVSAPAKPGKANNGNEKLPGESVKKQPLITVTLDPSLAAHATRLTDNQLSLMEGTGRPNAIDTQLAIDIPVSTLNALNREDVGIWDSLLNQFPNWDAAYSFHKHWNEGITNDGNLPNNATMSSFNLHNSIYNDNYVGALDLYGQPQQFRSPETAKLLGKAPVISLAELNKIAKNGGDSSKLWSQTIGRQVNYEKALMSELEAGDTDPAIINRIVSFALVNNQSLGSVGESRDQYKNTLSQDLEKLYNSFMADPKKATADFNARKTPQLIQQSAFMMDYHRLMAGYPIENDAGNSTSNETNSLTLSNAVVLNIHIYQQPDGKKIDQLDIYNVEFINAPTGSSTHDAIMPVIVDHITKTVPDTTTP